MDIGEYSFEAFQELTTAFHGYPAPGILVGGYMVETAKSRMPPKTLFEALVETPKCLPDAVQLLTLCSTGNNWMKIINLGRFALSLYDKFTGLGWRVGIDPKKLQAWPEITTWFYKLKPKTDQNSARLFAEIEQAGADYTQLQKICINPEYLGKKHTGKIAVCPVCNEAFPENDGGICLGCQGKSYYHTLSVF